MKKILCVAVFIVLGYFTGVSYANAGAWAPHISDAAEAEAKAKREAIQAEIETLGEHPWAGRYYEGDGLGSNRHLTLAPENGFVYTVHGCLGLYNLSSGNVVQEGGLVKLTFSVENDQKEAREITVAFVPIPWGDRHYLVPSEKMVEFCNQVNRGERIHHFLRFSDKEGESPYRSRHKIATPGLPDVPEKYKPYLRRHHPIEAEITAMGETTNDPRQYFPQKTVVTLDKGTKDGLLPGMTLAVIKPEATDLSSAEVTVTDVKETSAEGILAWQKSSAAPAVGWKLSTRSRWAAPVETTQDTTDKPASEP